MTSHADPSLQPRKTPSSSSSRRRKAGSVDGLEVAKRKPSSRALVLSKPNLARRIRSITIKISKNGSTRRILAAPDLFALLRLLPEALLLPVGPTPMACLRLHLPEPQCPSQVAALNLPPAISRQTCHQVLRYLTLVSRHQPWAACPDPSLPARLFQYRLVVRRPALLHLDLHLL